MFEVVERSVRGLKEMQSWAVGVSQLRWLWSWL